VELEAMTTADVGRYLESGSTVALPAGSIEQHGEMAPLGCDALVAGAVCRLACEMSGTVMAPVLAYGMSESHTAFPGTLSLAPTTMTALVRDVACSLLSSGFTRILVLNSHGGNRGPLLSGLYEAAGEHPDARLRMLCYWELPGAAELEEELFPGGSGFHATAAEVSMLMHLRPGFRPVAPDCPVMDMPARGEVVGAAAWRRRFPDGPCGVDPKEVSAEKGRILLSHLADALAALLGGEW
jgi:creatinine amidohydrolase